MASRLKLTTNSEEANAADLLSGDKIFSIPYFQRPYKWTSDKLERLETDLGKLLDDDGLTHFFGAVIIHGRRSSPADPKVFDVIDGQQRITTLFIYIMAALRILSMRGLTDQAAEYFQTYIAMGRKTRIGSNFKLHSCKEDRRQLNKIIDDLTSDAGFAVKIGNYRPEKLSDTGPKTGQLLKNYEAAKGYFEKKATPDPTQVIVILDALLERVSIVQIDVVDPTNGPKIFDGLNSQQQPMSVGDLIRNEIFSKTSSLSPDEIDYIDEHSWQPFYQKFRVSDKKNLFDSYFFPYGLIRNPNLNKSQVYSHLRDGWKVHPSPDEIVRELAVYQDSFLDLMVGGNTQNLPPEIAQRVKRFHDFDFPTSALPFLMQLTYAVKTGGLATTTAAEVLDLTESFLVRRAICGIEPTGLHSVFRRLWVDAGPSISAASVEREIRDRVTVSWPDDEYVKRSIRNRPVYKSAIAPYLIRQYDVSLGADVPADIPWTEHVLPQKPSTEWYEAFSKEQVKSLADTLANLIPLTSRMNTSLGNDGYDKKRGVYLKDAMFKSARKLAEENTTWTPAELSKRANELASWAVDRWPH